MPRPRLTIRRMMAAVAVVGIVMGASREGLRFWRWYTVWSKHADAVRLLQDTAEAWDHEADEARRNAARRVPYGVGRGLMPVLGPIPRESHIPMNWKEEEAYCRVQAQIARASAEEETQKTQPFRWLGP